MAEKVGLIAVLDMRQFNRSFQQYSRSLNQMNTQTISTSRNINNSFLGLGDSVLSLAGTISKTLVASLTAAGVALGAFVGSGIRQAADLEAQLDGINAILGNTEQQGLAVKDAILQLGVDEALKVSASEAAQAIELLARNGLTTNEIIGESGDIMESAAFSAILLANATGADFGLAADIATDAMAVFGLQASDMVSVVDDIVGVTNNSKFTIQDYALAIRNGGAAAADMGVSLTDFNTVIAASAEELGSGMKAGTGFREFIRTLTPSTKDATEAMQQLGFITADGSNIFFDASGNLKSMNEVSQILNQTLNGTRNVVTEVGGRTAEQNQILAGLRDTYSKAQTAVFEYTNLIKGANLSDDARNKKIADQQAIMDALLPKINDLEEIRGELITTTQKLTDAERSAALEAIFGSTAMNTVLALAKEGEPAFTDVATAMQELGVSQAEATRIVEEGVTAYELLYNQIADTDAVDQAEQKMLNLQGSLEILKGIFETLQIEIGDAFLPILTRLTDEFKAFVSSVAPLVIAFFQQVAGFITEFVQALIDGEQPLKAFTDTLNSFGFGNLTSQIDNIVESIDEFITPIIDFVQNHSEAFIGALKGIGTVLASAAIATKIMRIVVAIGALLNPITLLISAAATIGAAIQTDFAGAGTAFANIVDSIKDGTFTWADAWDEVVEVVENVWNMIEPTLTRLWQNITNWFLSIDWQQTAQTVWQEIVNGAIGLWELLLPHLIVLQTNIATWFIETNWAEIGQTLWDTLLTGGGNLIDFILPQLQSLFTTIQTWFTTVDWAAVGAILYNGLLGTAETLGETVGTWVSSLIVLITEFLVNTDWMAVGETIITSIGTAFVALLGVFWTYLNIWFEFISSFVESADWLTIATNLVTSLFTAIGELLLGITNILNEWYLLFVNWVTTVDWLTIGTSIVTFILNGLATFVSFIGETLATWFSSFVNWVVETDWQQIGNDIVGFILDGLLSFVELVIDTYAQWFETFTTWVENTDWVAIGENIVDFIIAGLELWYEEIPLMLAEWALEFIDWVLDTDWKQLGIDIVNFILEGLALFSTQVTAPLGTWWQAFVDWFNKQDWGSLAKKVIDGIIGGLRDGAVAVGNAISGLVEGMSNRWDQETESQSPSKLFEEKAKFVVEGIALGLTKNKNIIDVAISDITNSLRHSFEPMTTGEIIGNNLIEGIKTSLEDGQNLLEEFLSAAGDLGGIGGAFANLFKKREIDPLEDELKLIDKQIKDTFRGDRGKDVKEFVESFDLTNVSDLESLLALFPNVDRTGLLNDAFEYLELNEERLAVAEEIAKKEEKILELQKQQQDLQLLEQQFKLLELIQSKGLDGSQILGGLELGLNANLPDLITAMTNAMQQLIGAAESELGIQSPSKVFERIAQFTLGGFIEGTRNETNAVLGAMTDFTRSMVSTVTGGLSNITNNNQQSKTVELNLNNNFSSQPQITDRSQMELLLASFV